MVLLLVSSAAPIVAEAQTGTANSDCAGNERARMARVDLFFGAGRVSPSGWQRFVATVVTPRFPDGLTSFDASGQWRSRRALVAERTRVLVIYYRPTAEADIKIEQIRAAYKTRFSQASVLRADSMACVSF